MSRPKKEITCPRLNNVGDDVNKDWYVEFSVRSHDSGKMERKRIYDGFKDLATYDLKMEHAENILFV